MNPKETAEETNHGGLPEPTGRVLDGAPKRKSRKYGTACGASVARGREGLISGCLSFIRKISFNISYNKKYIYIYNIEFRDGQRSGVLGIAYI